MLTSSDHRRPNFVLLTVECWRGDQLGALTPCISELATESITFSNAQTCGGWTVPAMTALMSSAYASMHGGTAVAMRTPSRKPVAECLLESGYWTAGFTANQVCGTSLGFHRGFGAFWVESRRKAPPASEDALRHKGDIDKLCALGVHPSATDDFCDAAQMTSSAIDWLNTCKTDYPFFLWVHYFDPHWPCLTPGINHGEQDLFNAWNDRQIFRKEVRPARGRYDPGPEARERWFNRYRSAVASTDKEIGRLTAVLRSRDDWGNTVVVATGDHGEEMYEHGTWHHSWNRLYSEGIHVPFVIRIPGVSSKKIAQAVSHIDLAPTILDYAGVRQPRSMLGASLRPFVSGVPLPPRAVYSEMLGHENSFSYRLAILDGDWKYIYDLEDPLHSQLFRLDEDPTEKNNLRDHFPSVFRQFERDRLAHVTHGLIDLMSRQLVSGQSYQEELVKQQLVALGYL